MDKGMLNLFLEANTSLLFAYTNSYLHKRLSHTHIYIFSYSKNFWIFVQKLGTNAGHCCSTGGSRKSNRRVPGQIKRPEVDVGGCWEGTVRIQGDLPSWRLPVGARRVPCCLRDISTKVSLSLSFMKLWHFLCSDMSLVFWVDHGCAIGDAPAQVYPIFGLS